MRAPSINAEILRATSVDRCGRVIPGPASSILTEGFVRIAVNPEVEEGEDKTTKKANGRVCATSKGEDQIKWYNLEVELCVLDPDVVGLFNRRWPKVVSNLGRAIGWEATDQVDNNAGVALETWTNIEDANTCEDPTATGSWGYFLLPWTTGWRLNDFELNGDYLNLVLTGRAKNGSKWGRGPYDVVLNGVAPGTPGPLLDPVGGRAHYRFEQTLVAPPTEYPGLLGVSHGDATDFTVTPAGLKVTVAVTAGGAATTVDWGDGTSDVIGSDNTVEHTYAAGGVYQLAVHPTATPGTAGYALVALPA